MSNKKGVVGIFSFVGDFIKAAEEINRRSEGNIQLYSPVPVHELDYIFDKKESKVRLFTLFGAITGFALGWFLTLFTSFEWNLITGGKAVGAIPPFIIVAFEFTVLFGALATFAGLFVTSKISRKKTSPGYKNVFTEDKFGIFIEIQENQIDKTKKLLRDSGAESVRMIK